MGVVIWKTLRHPNVLLLLGFVEDKLTTVSEWMTNGDINEFAETHPDANRLELARRFLPFLGIYAHTIVVARRRDQGDDLHAWPRGGPRKPQRGMCLHSTATSCVKLIWPPSRIS